MSAKQYCFNINNPYEIEFDINALKLFVKNLYVGTEDVQFDDDEKIPFITIHAREDNNVCILMTSRGAKNIERIETINNKLVSKDLQWENGISLGKPYEFNIDIANWWVNSKPNVEGKRWRSLRHNGPYFTNLIESYEPLGASLSYEGKKYPLTPDEEKIASFYAKRKISEMTGGVVDEWTKDSVFNNNFWNDFKKYLNPEHKKIFKNFNKLGWEDLISKIEANKGKDVRDKSDKKIRTEEKKREYGYAWLDGKREKVGNFTVEPQAIFYGRGANPNRGKVKAEINPEDVTINVGESDPVPVPPTGHKWKNVVHDHSGVWLAKWNDSITGDTKYVMFSSEGRFKGESDLVKYEKARKLEKNIDALRERYMSDASSKNIIKMQLGTVLYLIDHFGVRIGNERDEDEADTVGASTLRVGHVKLKAPDHVIFDFLGKDSIRFYKDLKVPFLIYDNFAKLLREKEQTEQVFHSISSRSINDYLKEFDNSFTAKVFRTRLASKIMFNALKNIKIPKSATKAQTKVLFNKANSKVAEVLNHTRNVSKKAQDAVKKIKQQLVDVEKELKKVKKDGKSTKALEKKKESLKTNIEAKSDVMTVAINTSLKNYIDPRMIVAWSKLQGADLSAIYTTSLMRNFQWAISTTEKNWNWEESPLISNQKLEPLERERTSEQTGVDDKPVNPPINGKKSDKVKPVNLANHVSTHPLSDLPTPVSQISTVLLLGDSIIDNAYWNDVGKDTTAQYLRNMGIRVIDRAAEEAYTEKFFKYFNNQVPGIPVGMHYVDERAQKTIPYDGFIDGNTYYVDPVPKGDNKQWWNTPKDERYAVLSLGGNDLVLVQNLNVENIQQRVEKVIQTLLHRLDLHHKNFIYIIPYPPNSGLASMIQIMVAPLGITVKQFYQKWVETVKTMCKRLGIRYISLEDFTSDDKGPDNTRIPEPTKQGARKIAERIYNVLEHNTSYTGPGTVEDYKLLLRICKDPNKYKKKIYKVSRDAMEWIVHFSRYAINKGIQVKANDYIVQFYDAAYKRM